jgi:hypothetical protein
MTAAEIFGIILGVVALCGSIIGSAWWMGRELGEIKTRLLAIDGYMATGSAKVDRLDLRVDEHESTIARHDERIISLEAH